MLTKNEGRRQLYQEGKKTSHVSFNEDPTVFIIDRLSNSVEEIKLDEDAPSQEPAVYLPVTADRNDEIYAYKEKVDL